ncbi:hypothetical protein FA13DRAFT_1816885 [Coprinellus micaceus]|uniref:G domain-containing protein n=1 Tax=Coprinellus micaceus TaxID=71717 RepID=A0A4Y7SX63_COPMI|nr:hypothetical protein FA13DRAFT_1816885 [Coprinellus micaceus]
MAKLFSRDRASDPRWGDARDTDIVVPVIGDTGAGKSYFINQVLHSVGRGDGVVEGKALEPCTGDIRPVVVENQTEGYRHLKNPDFELLKRLADWLKDSYRTGTVLGGIVYLHDISATRCRPDGFQKKLERLNQLYDDKVPFSAVVFVTSKWGYDPEEVSMRRETQYQEDHWKNILKPRNGEKEEGSAWDIVASILKEVEERAVNGVLSEVQRIERNSISARDAQAASDLRSALENMRQAEAQMLALQESVDGDSDSERKRRLGEAEQKRATPLPEDTEACIFVA